MVLPARITDLNSDDFRKCGEIRSAVKVGKKVYAFHCTFCAAETCLPFLSFENFMMHMEEHHSVGFDVSLRSEETDEELLEKEEKHFLSDINKTSFITMEASGATQLEEMKFSDMIKESKVPALHLTDPLDLPPLGMMSGEFSKQSDVSVKDEFIIGDYEDVNMSDNQDCNNPNNTNSNDDVLSQNNMNVGNHDTENDTGLNGRDITLAIIASYENQRLLWDADYPNAKILRQRQDALKRVTDTVNEQMGVRLKVESVSDRIRKIRYKYRCAYQNQTLTKSGDPNYTPLWYYDKLKFLNETINYKQRNLKGSKALINKAPTLPLSGLTETQTLQLIEIYKSFPCLWDRQHIGYRFPNQRQDAVEEMIQDIKNKMSLDYTQDQLQKKINRIRYAWTQEKHRILQCELLKEEFKPNKKYYEKISFLEEHVGPFKCPFCDDIFNGADQYKMHKYSHDGTKPLSCPLCNHGFMDTSNYKVHLRRHTRDYPYECKVCAKRFATATEVSVHMRHHTGEKPYFCEICGQSCRTQSFFRTHMRRHQKQPSHKCTICKKTFYEKYKLNEHMKAHLNVRDKVCNICDKTFTNIRTLRQHKQIHADKKKYVCKICSKDFAQYAGLSGHMKTHGTTISGAFVDENP